MSVETLDLTLIRKALRRYRRVDGALRLIECAVRSASFCLAGMTIIQVLFGLIPLTLFPLLWDCALAMLTLWLVFVFVRTVFINPETLAAAAQKIETSYNLSPRWLSLSLELSAAHALGSEELKNQVAMLGASWLSKCSLKPRKLSRKTMTTLTITLIAWACSCVFVKPFCGTFWDMPLSFISPPAVRVLPGSVVVPMRSSIELRCIPTSAAYPSCRLIIKDLISREEQSRMLRPPDSSGAFSCKRDSLTRSFSYRFSIGMIACPEESVRVVMPPALFGIQVRVAQPAYCGLPPKLLADGQGGFSALSGSKATITITSSSPLSGAYFCSSLGDTVACRVNGRSAVADIAVLKSCSYTFSLIDTFGQKSDSLPSYFIEQIADAAPTVQFLRPAANKELSAELAETLSVEAQDDFGISQLTFHWRANREASAAVHERSILPSATPQSYVRRDMAWDVRPLMLYPGDTVFYWAKVRDNDPFDATHWRVTDTFWLRLPSFEEIHDRLARRQDAADASLQSARQQHDNIKNTLGNLLKSTKGNKALSWEQKQILSDLKESLKAQSDTLTKAIESLNESVKQLKAQGMSSTDLLEKMDKVKKALEDIARQYGDSLLFKQPRPNETLDAQDLKNALEKFKRALPDLSRQLDNALKYLEMLKKDQQLAQLADRAQHLGARHMEAASETQTSKRAIDKQEELTKNTEDLLSDVKRLLDADSQQTTAADMPAFKAAQSELQAMRQAMKSGTAPQKPSQERMAGSMFSMAQSLRDMQSSAMMRKMKQEQDHLLEMSSDALAMAQWQRELADQHALAASRKKLAQAQQSLKQALSKSAEGLDRLSMAPPQMLQNLMNQFRLAASSMDNAIGSLQNEQDPGPSMGGGEQALNSLANSLLSAAGAMDGEGQGQGGGEGEMMSGFQRLSGKQAMINCATGNILRQMLGGQGMGLDGGDKPGEVSGQGSEQAEKARQEAQAAQKAVADALQKLSETYGKQAGEGMDAKAKDLEQEARRLAKMLENPQPEIQDRQQRFLSRMLETSLSMHKQDEGKDERKSESARNPTPTDIQQSSGGAVSDRDAFFRLRQKAFSGNFPETYRRAVRTYFDSLGLLFLKEK